MRVVHNHPSFSTLALALAVYADHVRSFVRLIRPFDSSLARSASRPVPASHLVAMSLFTRALARGCASTPSTSACARSRARVAAFHGGLFAPSRARIPRDARAAADLGRERAAELARDGDDDDAYDDDPLVHMGRTNKSELKRRGARREARRRRTIDGLTVHAFVFIRQREKSETRRRRSCGTLGRRLNVCECPRTCVRSSWVE